MGKMGLLTAGLKKKRTGVVKEFISGDVLDVGCGYAANYEAYHQNMKSYFGIEMTNERVGELRKKYPKAKFEKRDLDSQELNLNKKFDCILSVAVIEHLFNQKFSFEQILKHLKSDGKIIITTPTPIGNDIVHRIGSRIGMFNRNAHNDHIVIYNKKRFEILANEFDLNIDYYRTFQLGCNQIAVLSRKTP